jgi:tetratricopeptide (TPR) repeat protein
MRSSRRILATIFGLLIFIHAASAQEARAFPELIPLPSAVALGQRSEPLSADELIAAALAFSSSEANAAARDRILAHARRFQAESLGITDQGQLAEGALRYLHENVLTRYSVFQSRVDTAVDTGTFNCVSSAVLYAILARSVGLAVAGVRTVDHAFCSVMVNGVSVDVETTNAAGFDPGSKKEFTDSFGAVTGYSYVPPSSYRDRRAIGMGELLALILYNTAAEQGAAGHFREAIGPAVSAYAFVRTEDFRQAMDITFSNYASLLAMRGDFRPAIDFLDAAKSSWGERPDLAQRRQEITHNWIVSLVQKGSRDEAAALLEAPSARGVLGSADWTDLSVFLVQSRAEAAARTGGYREAAEKVAAGLKSLGQQPELLRAYEAYVHNAFAQLYNARRFEEARQTIEDGLSAYPTSRTLGADLQTVQKAQRQ